jgi:hypothetical protein
VNTTAPAMPAKGAFPEKVAIGSVASDRVRDRQTDDGAHPDPRRSRVHPGLQLLKNQRQRDREDRAAKQ